MVFFSCDGCGEMLKKSAVDNHAARCRRCHAVSCVDCSVSFYGDDYRAHTSCISEVERYEKVKPKKNGKVPPQQMWMDLIADAVDTAPSHLKEHLRAMCTLDNVPRKEKPFRNFTKNSLRLGGRGEAIVSEIWTYLKSLREKQQGERAAQLIAALEQQKETMVDESIKVKKSTIETIPVQEKAKGVDRVVEEGPSEKTVKKAMKKVLKKAKAHSLTVKVLRKSVLEQLGASKSDSFKKLVKQNLKSDIFVVDGKTVTLRLE